MIIEKRTEENGSRCSKHSHNKKIQILHKVLKLDNKKFKFVVFTVKMIFQT